MTSITHLPDDVFREISQFLAAEDYIRLALCVNRAFTTRLKVIMTRFYSERPRFGLFPFLAFELPFISEISVKMAPNLLEYPLTLNHRSILPENPVTSLLKLSLSFSQSLSILDPVRPLSAFFPNLTELEMSSAQMTLQSGIAPLLPATLTHLSISSKNFETSPQSYSLLHGLPSGLQTLSLRWVHFKSDTDEISNFEFPGSLVTLILGVADNLAIVRRLPQTLTHLNLSFSNNTQMSRDLKSSELPPNLRFLSFSDLEYIDSYMLELDAPLPAMLTHLHLPQPIEREEAINFLPKSLTSFKPTVDIDDLGALFPNLTAITLAMDMNAVLPPKLQDLRSPARIPNHRLPLTLNSLCLPFPGGDFIRNWTLPELTKLQLCSNKLAPPSLISALPPTITDLSLYISALESLDVIQALIQLKKLELLLPTSLPSQHEVRIFGPFIPPNVTHLTLTRDSAVNQTGYLPIFSYLKHIRLLFLSCASFIVSPDPLTLEPNVSQDLDGKGRSDLQLGATDRTHPFLKLLPSSLTELKFTIPSWVSPQSMLDLPRNLLKILCVMRPDPKEDKMFGDDYLQYFPASLTSLQISGSCIITPDAFLSLPNLSKMAHYSLLLGSVNRAEKARLEYYSHPRWQGLEPSH